MSQDFIDDELKSKQYHNGDNYAVRVRFHETCGVNPQDQHDWVFDAMLAGIPTSAKILELGCGRGDIWRRNVARIPQNWQITLSDYSQGMLDDCQQSLGAIGQKMMFRVIDAQEIPLESASLDAVVANLMLYHVPDRNKALGEIARILKPDGALYAMTLGENHMSQLYNWVAETVPELNFSLQHTDNPFTLENAENQLRRHFDDVKVHHFEDHVSVTDVDLLTEYISSLTNHDLLLSDANMNQKFKSAARAVIERDGAITSRKEVGLFIAHP